MTSPWIWSHRLHNRPISSLSNLRLPHKAHLLIFITSGLPHMGNLSLDLVLGLLMFATLFCQTTRVGTHDLSCFLSASNGRPANIAPIWSAKTRLFYDTEGFSKDLHIPS